VNINNIATARRRNHEVTLQWIGPDAGMLGVAMAPPKRLAAGLASLRGVDLPLTFPAPSA
jgi:hypothetical protein